MRRATLYGSIFTLTLLAGVAATVPAQVPQGNPISHVTVPDTPVGRALRAWLDAFNSGDTAKMHAYFAEYDPTQPSDALAGFRDQTGGFDLSSIDKSDPRHIEFVVRERRRGIEAFGEMDVSATEPPRATGPQLVAMGPNATLSDLAIDAAERRRAVEGATRQLDEFYVYPDVAKRMDDAITSRLASGAYDSQTNGIVFANLLTTDLQAVSHDKHLRVTFSARPLPPLPPPGKRPPPSADDSARMRHQMDSMNCGFVQAEVLPGNVGYLKFNQFGPPAFCGETGSAAMNFLAGTDALIVDLRTNGGGDPAMVTYLASYLFDSRTHLNDLWDRKTGETHEYWTHDVPGRHFGGTKPVYVLTSNRTFSGAEEFTYDLKAQQRATIVGETTGGGAHPVSGHPIDEHFMIGVPGARAINPITHTDWEGTGVEPDVKVPASDALVTAQRLIAEKRGGKQP